MIWTCGICYQIMGSKLSAGMFECPHWHWQWQLVCDVNHHNLSTRMINSRIYHAAAAHNMQVSLFLFWLLAWHRCSFCHRPHSAATVASNQWKTMFMPSTHTLFVMKNTETQDVNNIFRLHQQFHSFPLMGGRATVCAWLPLITIEADFFHLCSCMWWWYTYLARSLFCLCTLWGCGAIYLLWLSMPEQTRVQHEGENEHTVICLLRFVFFLSLCTVHTSRTNASCPNRQSHSWTHVKCITLIIICKSSVFNGLRLGCWITTIITKMYYIYICVLCVEFLSIDGDWRSHSSHQHAIKPITFCWHA